MEQTLAVQNMEKMLKDENRYSGELSLMRKTYLSGPDFVSYRDEKTLEICDNLYKQDLLERNPADHDAFRISDPVYGLVVGHTSSELKKDSRYPIFDGMLE